MYGAPFSLCFTSCHVTCDPALSLCPVAAYDYAAFTATTFCMRYFDEIFSLELDDISILYKMRKMMIKLCCKSIQPLLRSGTVLSPQFIHGFKKRRDSLYSLHRVYYIMKYCCLFYYIGVCPSYTQIKCCRFLHVVCTSSRFHPSRSVKCFVFRGRPGEMLKRFENNEIYKQVVRPPPPNHDVRRELSAYSVYLSVHNMK